MGFGVGMGPVGGSGWGFRGGRGSGGGWVAMARMVKERAGFGRGVAQGRACIGPAARRLSIEWVSLQPILNTEQIQRFVESLPGLFVVVRADEHFTVVAASQDYLRATQADLGMVGQPLFDVLPGGLDSPGADGGNSLRASLQRVIATQARDTVNAPVLGDDGRVEFIIHRVDEAAAVAAAPASTGDAQKMETLGRLTSGVAHDFNNLMMVVSGAISVLERQPDAGRQRQALEGMRRAVTRGTDLTRQLLGVGGGPALAPKPIDLPVCIGKMENLLNRTLGGKVRVVSQFPPDLWPVLADPGELDLALLNLGIHARDAMPEGGTVSITTENTGHPHGLPAGDYVRISVGDTGLGMTPAERERAFDASSAGLAQVLGFAKASGGSASIDSAPGLGTTVTLLLPRSRAAVPVSEAPREQLAVQRQGRVLVVEDDNEVAELVAEMLEHLGYQLVRAGTAAEALFTLAHDTRIDLVFSDVMMPGKLTGIDLARRVRREHPQVRVVLTSGYAESFAQQARNEGLLLLPKPYAIDELSALMERAMQARVH